MHWEAWCFEMAKTASLKSKDRSTRVGCVVFGPDREIRTVGYNGFVRGADDSREEWHQRPLKYKVTAHAELNAVCNATRCGTTLKGCAAYITLPPCSTCALAMVQSGICSVNFLVPLDNKNGVDDRWKDDFRIALDIFTEATVDYEGYSGEWDESGLDPKADEVETWITKIQEGA